jgi:hypothetical protein
VLGRESRVSPPRCTPDLFRRLYANPLSPFMRLCEAAASASRISDEVPATAIVEGETSNLELVALQTAPAVLARRFHCEPLAPRIRVNADTVSIEGRCPGEGETARGALGHQTRS